MRSWITDKIQELRSKDQRENFKDSHRLLCRGIVIAQTPARLGQSFAIRGLEQFRDHLVAATTNDAYVFDGKMTAAEFLAHHQERLGMTITNEFEIVEPGVVYPLAPKPQGIC